MTDEELRLQSSSLPTLYFDGYGNYVKINGVLRCVAYIIGVGGQYNIITSIAGADMANRATRIALDGKPTPAIAIWTGSVLPH